MSVPSPPLISVRPRVTPTTLEFWWQPPASPNGTISGYTLSCASPSITQNYGADVRRALITGLTAGTDYTFTLIATNENGNSSPATYRTVRTSAKPQPVATLTASNSVSNGLLSITFTWTNPGGGDYAYYYVLGLRAAAGTKNYIYRGTRTYSTLTYTIGNLDPTQLYAFHVQRGNDAGYSTQVLVTTTRATYFDPTSIAGLQVWYDAADTAGNGSTVADGTTVATWVDKSGNSRNATAAGGSATLQTDSAGRRLNFNGTTNRYNLPSSSWIYNTPYTVFVADTPSKINNAALIANSNGSADAFAMKYTTGTTIRLAGGGGNARIIYSYDGINWLPSSTDNIYPVADLSCNVIATNGIICIAGFAGSAPAMYSYDGIKWTPTSPPRNDIMALAWNGTIWVGGTNRVPNITSPIFTSPDGIKWTDTGTGLFVGGVRAVAWNGTLWVAGGFGTNKLAYSYDGVNWIESTSGGAVFTTGCYAVAWNGTQWGVAGGTGTNQLAYSTDGVIWTESTSGNALLTTACYAVAWNGTQWVAGGEGTNQLAYSTNGQTWTAATSPITTAVYTVSWDGTQWIAGGYGTNQLAYSADGITWTAATSANALLTRAYASTALTLGPTTYNASITANTVGNATYTLNTAVKTKTVKTGTQTLSTNTFVAGGGGANKLAYSVDGVTWIASTSGNAVLTSGCYAVAWNGTQWVAGGGGTNQLAYSTDGITWTASTSGNAVITASCNAVAWNGTRWVAGGEGTNQLAYSADGITWTASTSGNAVITNQCFAVAWNGTRWVAGGVGTNQLAYSTDGITWTASTSGNAVFTASCYAVAWNGTRWVAGGNGTNQLAYSTDGITWTASASGNAVFTTGCNAVAWNGTQWVAGGGGTNQLAYSTDGITWTASTSGNGVLTTACYAVAWNGTRWVAGGSGTNQLAYSTDGITWTASTSGNAVLTASCLAIAWNGTRWVAGGSGTNQLAYSTDGITWTGSTSGNGVFTSLCYAVAQGLPSITQKKRVVPNFVGGGSGTNQLAYSYDGLTWAIDVSGSGIFTTGCNAVATNGSLWVAGGYGTNRLAYSIDGITWTVSTSGNGVFTTQCLAVATDLTKWVAGGFGINQLAYSTDGITWTASNSGNSRFTTQCNAVAWSGTQWVAGGEGTNQLAYSSDGITWTASTSGNSRFTTRCSAVAWNGTQWVAGGAGTNQLAYSADGITWTASTSGNAVLTTNCKAVAWNGTLWVAGGGGTNQLAYSYDGINWTGSTSGNAVLSTACIALSWNGILWTAGGSGTNQLAYSYDGIVWTGSTTGNATFTTQCSALATSYLPEVSVNILSSTTGAVRNLAWNGGGVNTDANAIQLRDATLSIGAVQGSTAFYQGGMREMLVYTGTLSDTNKAQITDYLYNKWNPPTLTLVPATPIKHGLLQWLDANDASTLFQDLSGTIPASSTEIVLLWKDKSGNGYDMYNNSSSTLTALSTIYYTLPGYSKPVPASKDISLFVVLKNNNVGNGYYSLWQHNNLGLNGYGQTGKISFSQEYDEFSTGISQSSATFTIYSTTMSKAQFINIQQISINGTTTVRNTVEIDSYYTGLGGPVVLCAAVASGGSIDVGELLYYDRVLSSTEISSTISFLQNKWGVAATPAGPNLTDNLQLWLDAADPYTVFETSGVMTIWKDRSVNGYNATPSGSPTYSDGGVVFNGTSQYFDLPNGALPSGNSPYSYYALIKPTDISGVGIIGGGADTEPFGRMAIEYTQINTFMVAGGNGTKQLAYSTDGITWTASTSGNALFTTYCYAVAWNGTRWVAGGVGTNQLAYSTDGITWTGSTSGNAVITNQCLAVAWNGTRWVAGGNGTNQLAYSTDGITWTASTSGNAVLTTACYAVASTRVLPSTTITPTTFLETTLGPASLPATAFVAGGSGTNRLAYSADGITWSASTSGNTVFTTYCLAVAWNGTQWVAGGLGTNQLAYSTDGITWTASTSGNGVLTSGCYAVAWNGTRWVAGGEGTNRLAYSADGITWTASTSGNAVFTTYCLAVAWNGTQFVAVGSGTNQLAYSTDGITWTASTSGNAVITDSCYAVAWNGTRWVAGGNGTNQLAYSSDGITWTASTSGNALFTNSCLAVASTRVLPSTSTTTPPTISRYAAAQGGAIPVNSLSNTTPFLVETTYSPTTTKHYVNAEQFAQNTSTPSHGQLTTNNTLGKTPWDKYMKGRIYEILVYNVAHTTLQRNFVEAYLLNKWQAFAFTPTSTATQPCLWLDSSNTDKLARNGTEITGWNDSSASGVNYTSMFPSANPEYSYDPITKKYGVLFGSKGVTSGLGNTTTSPFASTISQVSIFVVARFNNVFTTNTMYSSQTGASPMRFTAKNGNQTSGATITAPPENGATSPFAFSSSVITSPFVFSSVSTTTSNTNTISVNGTQAYTVSEAISITSGTLIYLGYGVNSPILSLSQGYNGYIFEYLIYPYAVSLAEQQKLEGYLAWKWGTQGSLAATHPYYFSAP